MDNYLIRPMKREDIETCVELGHGVGWDNMCADDLLIPFLSSNGIGCNTVVTKSTVPEIVGYFVTLATPNYNWVVAMVIKEGHRGHGLALRLDDLAYIEAGLKNMNTGVACILPHRAKYLKDYGFVEDSLGWLFVTPPNRQARTKQNGTDISSASRAVFEMQDRDLKDAIALDEEAFGYERGELIKSFPVLRGWVIRKPGGGLASFVLLRQGLTACRIGPVVANSSEEARYLIDAALDSCTPTQKARGGCELCVPGWHDQAKSLVESMGFVCFHVLSRIWTVKSGSNAPKKSLQYWAYLGPDVG